MSEAHTPAVGLKRANNEAGGQKGQPESAKLFLPGPLPVANAVMVAEAPDAPDALPPQAKPIATMVTQTNLGFTISKSDFLSAIPA